MVVLVAVLGYFAGNGGGYQERSRDAATGTSGKVEELASGEGTPGSGRIQALPHAEQRWGWGLTTDELERLTARPIYIRGESVTASS